jgi:RNA polymerase sigma-70 factor (ECF subfamily)
VRGVSEAVTGFTAVRCHLEYRLMGNSDPLTDLVERHRRGDPDAAGQLFDHYSRRLCPLAERYLSQKLAGRVEGEDIIQSVFRTFFGRTAKGEFQIDSRAQLWQLLVKITVLKARQKGRHHTAQQRDARIEQPMAGDGWLITAASREPGPEEAAALVDQIEALLHGLPPLYGEVLQRRLQGYAVAEIAGDFGVSRQTVYRALGLLQKRLSDAKPAG